MTGCQAGAITQAGGSGMAIDTSREAVERLANDLRRAEVEQVMDSIATVQRGDIDLIGGAE